MYVLVIFKGIPIPFTYNQHKLISFTAIYVVNYYKVYFFTAFIV